MQKKFILNKSVGFHLNRLAAAMRADFAARLDAHGFRVSDWALLAAIKEGVTTPGAIAEMMALDPAAVSRTVDRLVGLGLIRRSQSESDARSFFLELTPEGIRTTARLAQEARETNLQFTSVLTSEEQAQLIALLDRLFESRGTTVENSQNSVIN